MSLEQAYNYAHWNKHVIGTNMEQTYNTKHVIGTNILSMSLAINMSLSLEQTYNTKHVIGTNIQQ